MLRSAQRRSKYNSAARDTETAVTQAIRYARDKNAYPASLKVLRESGYANVPDQDPWGADYVLSSTPATETATKEPGDICIYSRGPDGTGTYTPGTSATGSGGAVGYSARHGRFTGS